MKTLEEIREDFEDKVFNYRFIKGISKKGNDQFPFVVDCPTQEEFCKRDGDSYQDPFVAGAWWGFQIAVASNADAERWRKGAAKYLFPEFCAHDDTQPNGVCWYVDDRTHNKGYETAGEAMDNAIDPQSIERPKS